MNLYVVTRSAADGMLNSLLAGVAIALLAWAVSRLVRRRGAGTRFAVWFLALIAVTGLPWIGRVTARFGNGVSAVSTSAVTLPGSFASYLFIAWIVGVCFGLVRLALSLYRLRRMRSTSTLVDLNQLDPGLRASLADARTHRPVTLCASDTIRVPAAIGYLRPMVVFPTWAFAEIPPTELNAILLHELAHLRRWDDWTNLAQKIVKAVFFFHPAVWFIESHLSLEREMACDDAVLAANFSPRAYAESLVGLAERSFVRRGVQLAQAAVSHVQQLKMRLAEILRKDRKNARQGSGRASKPAIALMSFAAIVSVHTMSRAPHLIAFSSDPSQLASATSAPHANLLTAEAYLQPVNLNYSGHAQSSVLPVRKIEPTRLRITHRVAPKPRVVLAQRTAEYPIVADDIAPPMIVLSNFPTDFSATSLLVMFQAEQFGVNGPIFWRVTVVHLTPAQQRIITGGFPKQI